MKDETRAEKLLNALNDTEDDMIISADPDKKSRKRTVPLWLKIGSAAAAVITVGGITTAVLMNRNPDGIVQPGNSVPGQQTSEVNNPPEITQPQPGTPNDENLPQIPVSIDFGSMGFEGYMLNDISDLASGNPWTAEQNISVMPVYKNHASKDDAGNLITTGLDFWDIEDELKQLLVETAARMGIALSDDDITDNAYSAEDQQQITEKLEQFGGTVPEGYFDPTAVRAITESFTIETNTNYVTRIEFTDPITLPYSLKVTDYDKAQQIAEYLMTEYSDLLNMENPAISIDGGDYYTTGERSSFSISFYESDGTIEQDIENYFMNYVSFFGDDNGDLWIISIYRCDLASEPVGSYPLISVEAAAEMLKNGEYASSVPVSEGYKPESYDRVELVYRTGSKDEYFIPYYKFLIDVTDDISFISEDKKQFGAFYVPAVQPEYIEDMPTYDGSFN